MRKESCSQTSWRLRVCAASRPVLGGNAPPPFTEMHPFASWGPLTMERISFLHQHPGTAAAVTVLVSPILGWGGSLPTLLSHTPARGRQTKRACTLSLFCVRDQPVALLPVIGPSCWWGTLLYKHCMGSPSPKQRGLNPGYNVTVINGHQLRQQLRVGHIHGSSFFEGTSFMDQP